MSAVGSSGLTKAVNKDEKIKGGIKAQVESYFRRDEITLKALAQFSEVNKAEYSKENVQFFETLKKFSQSPKTAAIQRNILWRWTDAYVKSIMKKPASKERYDLATKFLYTCYEPIFKCTHVAFSDPRGDFKQIWDQGVKLSDLDVPVPQ